MNSETREKIGVPFLGYNKNWKNNFKIPGYVVKITLYNLTNEESFAILVLNHKNESVRIESKKAYFTTAIVMNGWRKFSKLN